MMSETDKKRNPQKHSVTSANSEPVTLPVEQPHLLNAQQQLLLDFKRRLSSYPNLEVEITSCEGRPTLQAKKMDRGISVSLHEGDIHLSGWASDYQTIFSHSKRYSKDDSYAHLTQLEMFENDLTEIVAFMFGENEQFTPSSPFVEVKLSRFLSGVRQLTK